MTELIKIGRLSKLHGIKGALALQLFSEGSIDLKKVKCLFLDINNVPTPFFISEIKSAGRNLVVSFDSVNEMQAAQKLVGKEVLAEKKFSIASKEKSIAGYLLLDETKGELGRIKEVIDRPGQKLLAVLVNEKEVLLPFTDSFIKKTDHKTKTVYYSAPEGLIDMYLE